MKLVSSPFKERGQSYLGKIYRPYIEILITSKKIDEWIPIEILIDTGADYTLLPKRYAELLGINLQRDCYQDKTLGVGGQEKIYLYKKGITVKIASFKRKIPVGFLNRDNVPPLLGRLGCLEVLTLIMKDKIATLEL